MRNERAFGHSMWLWSRAHVKGSEWYLANGLRGREEGGAGVVTLSTLWYVMA